MDDVQISVIVALYNTIQYLPSFCDCLLKQTFKKFEVIIVDDLSTDGSYESAVSFAKEHPEMAIKIIKGTEKMLPDLARKIAFKYCVGKYVIYLDSDDEFSEDYLESLYQIADLNDLDFAVSSCQRINEKGIKKNRKRYLSSKTIPLLTDKLKKILIRGRYGGWNRMAKRSFLLEHSYDYLSAELPLFILQFDTSAKVGYTRKGCYFYRTRGGSISTTKVPQRIANYNLLEPIQWYKQINISDCNKKVLGIYLFRMILPYIYYKKFFVDSYDFKKDIKFVKKECNYSFGMALKMWWIMEGRDKLMLLAFMFHMHFLAFWFIKRFRS